VKIIPQSRRGLKKSSLTIVDKLRFWGDENTTMVIRPQRMTGQIWNSDETSKRGLDREDNDM
jgi:hypothetical protein